MGERTLQCVHRGWIGSRFLLFGFIGLWSHQEAIALQQLPLALPHIEQRQILLELDSRANSAFSSSIPSQGESSTLSSINAVTQHIRNAEGFIQVSLFQNALKELNAGFEIYETLGDRELHQRQLLKILAFQGLVYSRLSQNEDSLKKSKQGLILARKLNERSLESQILINIAAVHGSLSQYQQALETYEQAMAIIRDIGARILEATVLNNSGQILNQLSREEAALKNFNQALVLARETSSVSMEGTILNNMAVSYERLSQYQTAIETHNKALAIHQKTGNHLGKGKTLNNLALIFARLDQYNQARDIYQQALLIFRQVGDRANEGVTLNNIGLTYFHFQDYSKALNIFHEALNIHREVKNLAVEGITLKNIAKVHNRLNQYPKALETYQKSLKIHREVGNRFEEGQTLNHLGEVYHNLKQSQKALSSYHQTLLIRREVGDRAGEALTLSNLGKTLEDLQQQNLAIVFYKNSVNIYEGIRSELQGLSQDQRQSYTNSIASTYRRLADLLLQKDRILEAQQVLDLLKVQELDDYLNTVRGNDKTAKGITVLQPELDILRQFEESQASAIQLGKELTQLRQIDKDSRTQKQQKRLEHLVELQLNLNQDFNEFIDKQAVQDALNQLSRKAQRESVELDDLDALRDNLTQLNAVLLYPLILEDRVELVLTTPNSAPIRRTVYVSRQELNQTIVDFRRALQDPQSTDTQSIARQLYSWLIAPIDAELAEANTEAILYAPDGQLRYIPLGALHDGDEWLIQRLRINNITAKSFSNLNSQTPSELSILAGAFAKGQFQFQVGSEQFSFAGLPFAGEEVSQLIAMVPDTTHFLDQAFSLAAFQPQMNDHRIVHLATHAAFVPGQPEDSFILFGNGDRATLRDIGNWSLFNVDLVVLSACETGLGGKLGNGEEILGLGYQFQSRGAKATIASLWQVDDGGTQILMSTFYQQLKAGNISKAEALRQAQIKMISENVNPSRQQNRASVTVKSKNVRQAQKALPRLGHPYYWAPFILIGNGL